MIEKECKCGKFFETENSKQKICNICIENKTYCQENKYVCTYCLKSFDWRSKKKTLLCIFCGSKTAKMVVEIGAPGIQFKGLDFWTNRNRERNFAIKGYDKDHAKRFYKEAITNSKKRMNQGASAYKRYEPTDKLFKDIGATRKSDREVAESLKKAKDLTQQAYNLANSKGLKLDPTQPNQPQV